MLFYINFYKVADDTVMSTDVHECLNDSEQQVIAAFIEDMNNKQYNESKLNNLLIYIYI